MRSPVPPAKILVLVLAVGAVAQAAFAAWRQDWTLDERVHLEWSRRLLDERVVERDSLGRFNTKTPITLVNVLAHRAAGGDFDSRPARTAARLPTVFCLLLLFVATFCLAREATDGTAAWVALGLTSLDPNLIAHGSLATVDMPYSLATILVLWTALRLGRDPGPVRGALLGGALGLGLLAKFTGILLVLGLCALVVVVEKDRRWRARTMLSLGLVVVVALMVILGGYLFVDVGRPLAEVEMRSGAFQRLAAAWPSLRLPLPSPFLTGIDRSLAYERGEWSIVVLGRLHPHGVWYFFAFAWLLKTPLVLLGAQIAGAAAVLRRRLWTSPASLFLAANLLLGVAYFSFLFQAQLGYRFVLMCLPVACVLVAPGLIALAGSRRHWPRAAAAAAVVTLIETAPYIGNPLSFTNAAVWPKRQVFRLLADSNVDWGQNRDKIAGWMQERAISPDRLDPLHALPGTNVFTLNALAGTTVPFERHRWLRENADPVAHFGHTYLFFDVGEELYERLLSESRSLVPAPVAEEVCGADDAARLPPGSKVPFAVEGVADPSRTWLVCVSTPRGTDFGLHARRGSIQIAPRTSEAEPSLETVHQDQELWFRLEPGRHAFVVRQIVNRRAWLPSPFEGEWHVRRRGASVTVSSTTRSDPR